MKWKIPFIAFSLLLNYAFAEIACNNYVNDNFEKSMDAVLNDVLGIDSTHIYYMDGKKYICDKYEYDFKGRLVYDDYGHQTWYVYDSFGKLIARKDGNRVKRYEYDTNSNLVHVYIQNYRMSKLLEGELWCKYDLNGKLLERWFGRGNQFFELREVDTVEFYTWNSQYDGNGRPIYVHNSEGNEIVNEYDSLGRITYTKNSAMGETWYKYDENENQVYKKNWAFNSPVYEETWIEYDSLGNRISLKYSNFKVMRFHNFYLGKKVSDVHYATELRCKEK